MDDSRRLLKDVTNNELVVIFYNIHFQEYIDVIIQHQITGEIVSNITNIIGLDDLLFPIRNSIVRKNMLFRKLNDMIYNGVPLTYLNQHVIYNIILIYFLF